MKNLFASMTKLTMAMVAVFSLSSCGEDLTTTSDRPADPSKEKMTVFSTAADGTRTTIDANGIFYWQSKKVNNDDVNDQIWIDKDGTGASFSLQSSSSELYDNNRMGKFYFRGILGADTYKLSYTGFGSTSGDEVTIAANQQQLGWDNAEHIGTSGDCATATATKQTDGNYSFTLNHKANYLIFQPYAPASTNLNPYRLVDIEILDTEGNILAGTFPLKYDGLETVSGTNTSTSVHVSCSELNGEALTLPQSASKSIYAVILPRGGAEGGRALQVRYRVNTVSDGNFIVVQNISGNFEVNGARLIRHNLSVPAFPTVATFLNDGRLFAGINFKPAFLRRTNGNATVSATLELDTDPFVLFQYNQGAHGVPITEFQKRMWFTWNELAEIFGHANQGQGASWANTIATAVDITNSVTIGGKQYKLPIHSQYARLIETPNAGRAVVNYYPASYAAVKVDLSGDATYAPLGWANNTTHAPRVSGYLFFPDDAFILDAKIKVPSLNGRWNTTASNLTADELRNYISHGCMFLPAAGDCNDSSWMNRGIIGNYWSGTPYSLNPSRIHRFGFTGADLETTDYFRTTYYAVILVEQ